MAESRRERWLVTFERHGQARYISHLDTARALQRTFARAGVQLALSQGMRPKPRLALGLPLPVGVTGSDELAVADVLVTGEAQVDEAVVALSAAGPPGLTVREAQEACPGFRLRPQVAVYEACVPGGADELEGRVRRFMGAREHTLVRTGPKGVREVDVRASVPYVVCSQTAVGVRMSFAIRHDSARGAARPTEVLRAVWESGKQVPPVRDMPQEWSAELRRIGVVYEGLVRRAPVSDWLESHAVQEKEEGG